jgi:hypothetical protein
MEICSALANQAANFVLAHKSEQPTCLTSVTGLIRHAGIVWDCARTDLIGLMPLLATAPRPTGLGEAEVFLSDCEAHPPLVFLVSVGVSPHLDFNVIAERAHAAEQPLKGKAFEMSA